jgi:hypothetical protein
MPSYRPGNFGPQQPLEPQQQPPQKAPQQPGRTPGWAKWTGGIMVGLAVGLTVGLMGSGDTTGSTSSVSAASPVATVTVPGATTTTTVTAPPAVPADVETPAAVETPVAPETTEAPTFGKPKLTDFKLAVKTLKKSCFGSAGCNITYRVVVTYKGPALDPATDYTVTYAVKGGDDPQTNTFTVTGTDYTYDEQEFISTPRSSSKLTAVVTDIF